MIKINAICYECKKNFILKIPPKYSNLTMLEYVVLKMPNKMIVCEDCRKTPKPKSEDYTSGLFDKLDKKAARILG